MFISLEQFPDFQICEVYVNKTYQWSSNIGKHQNHHRVHLETDCWANYPNFSFRRSGIEPRTCFLESSEVMLILLLLGPHFENFCINSIYLQRKIMQRSSHSKQFSEFNSICLRDTFRKLIILVLNYQTVFQRKQSLWRK